MKTKILFLPFLLFFFSSYIIPTNNTNRKSSKLLDCGVRISIHNETLETIVLVVETDNGFFNISVPPAPSPGWASYGGSLVIPTNSYVSIVANLNANSTMRSMKVISYYGNIIGCTNNNNNGSAGLVPIYFITGNNCSDFPAYIIHLKNTRC